MVLNCSPSQKTSFLNIKFDQTKNPLGTTTRHNEQHIINKLNGISNIFHQDTLLLTVGNMKPNRTPKTGLVHSRKELQSVAAPVLEHIIVHTYNDYNISMHRFRSSYINSQMHNTHHTFHTNHTRMHAQKYLNSNQSISTTTSKLIIKYDSRQN
jgi:hypothetical protein